MIWCSDLVFSVGSHTTCFNDALRSWNIRGYNWCLMVDGELVRGYTYWFLSMNQRTSFHTYTYMHQPVFDGWDRDIPDRSHWHDADTCKKNLVATRNSNSQSLKQSNQWFRIEQFIYKLPKPMIVDVLGQLSWQSAWICKNRKAPVPFLMDCPPASIQNVMETK